MGKKDGVDIGAVVLVIFFVAYVWLAYAGWPDSHKWLLTLFALFMFYVFEIAGLKRVFGK